MKKQLTEEQVVRQVNYWWEKYTKYTLYQAKQWGWSEERVKKELDDKEPITEYWKNHLRQDHKWIPLTRWSSSGGHPKLTPATFLTWQE